MGLADLWIISGGGGGGGGHQDGLASYLLQDTINTSSHSSSPAICQLTDLKKKQQISQILLTFLRLIVSGGASLKSLVHLFFHTG